MKKKLCRWALLGEARRCIYRFASEEKSEERRRRLFISCVSVCRLSSLRVGGKGENGKEHISGAGRLSLAPRRILAVHLSFFDGQTDTHRAGKIFRSFLCLQKIPLMSQCPLVGYLLQASIITYPYVGKSSTKMLMRLANP